MERIVRGRSATLTHTFASDGVATNPSPDVATIGITRDDGTVLVAAGTATTDTGVGTVSFTLTPAQTATLDVLTVTWTATFGGQPQPFTDRVEIAGDVLFTIAEARSKKPMNNATAYPVAAITAMRTTVEQTLERELGYALVPRYKREKVSGSGTSTISLLPYVTSIRSVKLDGVAVTPLSSFVPSDTGLIDYASNWTRGFRNYEVVYEHGLESFDGEAREAALELAAAWISAGPSDPRATSMTTEDGTFSLATPGLRGFRYGLPMVDAFIQANSMRALVA